MIWTAPSFLREKAALPLPTVGYGRNFKQTMSERIVKLLIESFPKILLPKNNRWSGFLTSLDMFTADFMPNGREQPDAQERESL